ncbi:hypothetical protein GCM10029992_48730 [Glycomyces albus]
MAVAGGLMGVQVADDEQGAAGRDPFGDAAVEVELRRRRVRVVGRDQVESGAGVPDAQVRLDPLDSVGTRAGRGAFGGYGEGRGRDVGGGDAPAGRGQPDRLGARATPGIQRGARHQAADLAHEVRIRRAGAQRARFAVPATPPVALPAVLVEFSHIDPSRVLAASVQRHRTMVPRSGENLQR